MKKLLFLLTMVVGLSACTDEPEYNYDTISFNSYIRSKPKTNDGIYDTPTYMFSGVHESEAVFYVFDASNGEKFMEERIRTKSGEVPVQSKMIELLDNNKFMLSDGTIVNPILIGTEYSFHKIPDYEYVVNGEKKVFSQKNSFNFPFGKYYVVAVSRELFNYTNKYSGRYFELKKGMTIDERSIIIKFPNSDTMWGFVDWETNTW